MVCCRSAIVFSFIKAQRNNILLVEHKYRVRGHQLNLTFTNAHVQSRF